jgi:diketogulonate reductase-like aldo/keto reductase
MGAMESCIDSGKTRFIGVSNFSPQLMREAEVHLREARLVSNQVEYSLMEQGPKRELLPTCRKMGVSLVAYKPLGRGSLLREANPVLVEVAEAHGVTRAQVAINWLISQDGVFAIPKSSNPDHIKEIAGSVGWRLSASEFKRLSEAYA